MTSPDPQPGEFRSILERFGVGRRGRLLAAVLIVVLSPLWLALFFALLGFVVKVLKRAVEIGKSAAAYEAAWQRWRRRRGTASDHAPRLD